MSGPKSIGQTCEADHSNFKRNTPGNRIVLIFTDKFCNVP